MGIHFYYSDSIDTLKEFFFDELKFPTDPFMPAKVVVPNINVKRWLQLEYAKRSGVAMQIDFTYLEKVMAKLIDSVAGVDLESKSRFVFLGDSKNIVDLQLMILSIMESDEYDSDLEPLYRYLKIERGDDGSVRVKNRNKDYLKRTWQLAEKLVFYFREYEFQRVDMIKTWEVGGLFIEETDSSSDIERCERKIYQKVFFGDDALTKRYSTNDKIYTTLPRYATSLLSRVDSFSIPNSREDIYLFGLSQISDFYFQFITELEPFYNFHIFQQNFISTFKEQGADIWSYTGKYTDKNPYVNRYSRALQENCNVLKERLSGHKPTVNWRYSDVKSATTLFSNLKASLLHQNFSRVEQDRSLQIIQAPSIRREIEGVLNSIISNMEEDDTLKLTDIAILVPNIEQYRLPIRSVFDSYGEINYNLNDTTAGTESVFANAILNALQVATGSFTRPDIMGVLLNSCFLTKLAVSQEVATNWIQLVDNLNIYHSYDTTDRSVNSSEKNELFTWELALKRLRLGKIMGNAQISFQNVVPYSESIASDELELLVETLERLFSFYLQMREVHTGVQWKALLEEFVKQFFEIPEELSEEQPVENQLFELLSKLEQFDPLLNGKSFDITYIIAFLRTHLGDIPVSRGRYLSDGVTISKLTPMKPIPFKLVYIVGLGEGIFPSTSDRSTLDLRNAKSCLGDISKDQTDNYLFFELMMAVKEKLYLSYVAKDIIKDAQLYPSSVITVLTSYIEEEILPSGQKFSRFDLPLQWESVRNILPVEQAIESKTDIYSCYSDSHRLLCYLNARSSNVADFSEMANKVLDERLGKMIPESITTTSDESSFSQIQIERLTLRALARFIKNPAQQRLQLLLGWKDEASDVTQKECEPFVNENKYYLSNMVQSTKMNVLGNKITHASNEDVLADIGSDYDYQHSCGQTPDGTFGNLLKRQLLSRVSDEVFAEEALFQKQLEELQELLGGYQFVESIEFGEGSTSEFARYPAVEIDVAGKIVSVTGFTESFFVHAAEKKVAVVYFGDDKYYYSRLNGILSTAMFLHYHPDYEFEQYFVVSEPKKDSPLLKKVNFCATNEDINGYLHAIIESYVTDLSFDLIPMKLVASEAEHIIDVMMKSEQEKQEYALEFTRWFSQRLDTDRSGFYPKVTLSDDEFLANVVVPDDILLKICKYYQLLRWYPSE